MVRKTKKNDDTQGLDSDFDNDYACIHGVVGGDTEMRCEACRFIAERDRLESEYLRQGKVELNSTDYIDKVEEPKSSPQTPTSLIIRALLFVPGLLLVFILSIGVMVAVAGGVIALIIYLIDLLNASVVPSGVIILLVLGV